MQKSAILNHYTSFLSCLVTFLFTRYSGSYVSQIIQIIHSIPDCSLFDGNSGNEGCGDLLTACSSRISSAKSFETSLQLPLPTSRNYFHNYNIEHGGQHLNRVKRFKTKALAKDPNYYKNEYAKQREYYTHYMRAWRSWNRFGMISKSTDHQKLGTE